MKAEELSDIQPGPIRHKELSPELTDRAMKVREVVYEVYKTTEEQWLEGFRRDVNPESEIRIWEAIASAYSKFNSRHDLSFEHRKEAFGLLLVRSSTEDVDFSKFKLLSEDLAKEVVSYYLIDAQPIEVSR